MKYDSAIAANRFGLGAKPGELKKIDSNPRAWLLDQLQGPSRLSKEHFAGVSIINLTTLHVFSLGVPQRSSGVLPIDPG